MPETTPHAEPRPVAVALRYDANRESAPRIVAQGTGRAAERMIAVAAEAGVPVKSDPALASALVALDLDAVVPPALFDALAAIIAWAYGQEASTAR